MIEKLSIKGFKSVRELDLSCRRVNVFIGEPNTGKTNILEAMAMFCGEAIRSQPGVIRGSTTADLFWDHNMQGEVTVGLGAEVTMQLKPQGSKLACIAFDEASKEAGRFVLNKDLTYAEGGLWTATSFYLFESKPVGFKYSAERLLPPFGQNLADLLYSSKEARQAVTRFFECNGLRLNVDYSGGRLLVTKDVDGVLISFPYGASSETLRRMVFYQLALDTNRDTILVFDEPEAHAFPPFTKRLAERIATDDRGNQFFLTTHSPYMLDSLLSKTPAADLNVVLCRMEGFETKAYPLNEAQIGKLMEWSMDAFFNFDRLLDSDA